jgi:chorismate-pyruvate lyase
MIATAAADLLYPLTLFCAKAGHTLPACEVIEGTEMPQPYHDLLVHQGDMTSRLAAFHRGEIVIEVLHHEHTPETYRREVVLRVEATGLAVEYGAIEIDMNAFEGEVRRLILEEHLPLGGLLNRFGIAYRSEPKAFIRLGDDAVMQRVFEMPEAHEFFGRSNLLLGENERVLARIVEVLRPLGTNQSYLPP